jgi:hypothetical protein
MRARVFPLRDRGKRTRRAESFEGVEGELQITSTMHGIELHTSARLCARIELSVHDKDMLPPLYAPVLVALGRESLLLRGFQSEDGSAYVQEWRCVIGGQGEDELYSGRR